MTGDMTRQKDEIGTCVGFDIEEVADMGRDLESVAAGLRAGNIGAEEAAAIVGRCSDALAEASRRCSYAYEDAADGKSVFLVSEDLVYERSILIEAETEEEARDMYISLCAHRDGGKVYRLEAKYTHVDNVSARRAGLDLPLQPLYAEDVPLPAGLDRIYAAARLNRAADLPERDRRPRF